MYCTSLLLIDLGRTLGPALRKILESSSFHGIVYLRESVKGLEPSGFQDHFSKIFSIFKFDIALLVLPPEFRKNVAEMNKWVRSQPLSLPIISLIESEDYGGGFTVIGGSCNGVAVPGPLGAANVLPFIWETVGHLHLVKNPLYLSPRDFVKEDIIGNDSAFLAEVKKIPVAAGTLSNVFIAGATGTGKRLFAKKIHLAGATADKPFALLCCGALSKSFEEEDILDVDFASKGSALSRIEGGTLFLDEVGCLPQSAQIKLLHFLENKQYPSLQSGAQVADFRVVAGSSEDAEDILNSGKLRRDLYYRLNIISFKLPTLKGRGSDIPLLADYFLKKFASAGGKHSPGFSPEALRKLTRYEWPGNIRELEYTIRRTITFMEGNTVQESDIRLPVATGSSAGAALKKPRKRPQNGRKRASEIQS